MSFFDLANSPLLYGLVALGICYVILFALLFIRKSWKRAIEIGMTKDELMNVVKSSAIFTVVPSLAIVIGLFSLVAILGIPWPWFRLSVIGSVAYELMAADAAVKVLGIEIGSLASAGVQSFVLIMYVMSISILGGIIVLFFIGEKLSEGVINMKEKDPRWGALGNSTFMMALLVVMTIPMILEGGVKFAVLITSALVAVLLSLIIKKFKIKWLQNFVLATSLIAAMASSILWTQLLG
jgi:hypothetical protein